MRLWKKIKENHMAMMLICCGVPLIGILVARYIFNYDSKYLVWIALAICIGSHFFMMKDMHSSHNHAENKEEKKIKSRGDCH